jgi:hypothetical protein
MALFGNGGTLELSREWPKPMALRPSAIGYGLSPIRIEFGNQDYWTGDQIIFACASGLPFDQNGDGYADAPDGHGIYRGGQWQQAQVVRGTRRRKQTTARSMKDSLLT